MSNMINTLGLTWESITALGTIFAVVVALMLPFLQRAISNSDQKRRIKTNLALELFMNYKGVMQSEDSTIDKEQYNVFKDNMNMFPTKHIEDIALKLKRFYELFEKYEQEKRILTNASSQITQLTKYKIQVLMLNFLGILSESDKMSPGILTLILKRINNYQSFDDVVKRYSKSPFLKFLQKKTSLTVSFNNMGDYICETEFEQMVSIALDYLSRKYKVNELEIRALLKKRISSLF